MAPNIACQKADDGPGWHAQVDATMQHLALLKRKRARLLEAQVDAEAQVLQEIAARYDPGQLDKTELATLYAQFAGEGGPGYQDRWNAAIPVTAARMEVWAANAPTGPFGTWHGDSDSLIGVPHPLDGVCVVYILFDAANVPCYIGSTIYLAKRFKDHRKTKDFASWTAYRCANREAAYELEDRLLGEHQPYLNKRAGR